MAYCLHTDGLNPYLLEDLSSSGPERVSKPCFQIAISRSSRNDPLKCCNRRRRRNFVLVIDPALEYLIRHVHESQEHGVGSICLRRIGLRTASRSYLLHPACRYLCRAGLNRYLLGDSLKPNPRTGDVLTPFYLWCWSSAIGQTLISQSIWIVILCRGLSGKYHCSQSSGHPFRKAPSSAVQLGSSHP